MFDINKIKAKANTLLNAAERNIKVYAPEGWVKERVFINAISASMALMVISDKKIEEDEIIAVMEFIPALPEVEDLNLQKESIELFELHLGKLEEVMNVPSKFLILKSKMLADIAKVKEHQDYVIQITGILDHVAGSDGDVDPSEVKMKEDILAVLK